jgi:hypothetical protein
MWRNGLAPPLVAGAIELVALASRERQQGRGKGGTCIPGPVVARACLGYSFAGKRR